MPIDFPSTPVEPTLTINDPICSSIASFLKSQLNELSTKAHGRPLVNTTRDFKDVNVPLKDYPVLFVYRPKGSDYYSWENQRMQVSITIIYAEILRQDHRQQSFLSRIGKYIHNYISKVDGVILNQNVPATGTTDVIDRDNKAIGTYTYNFGIFDSSVPESLVNYLI